VAFVIHATYNIGVTNFGDYLSLEILPWYAAPKVPLLRFLWHFQESFRTSVLNRTACPETNISLKATVLSASALVCCDHLCPECLCRRNQSFLKFLYSSMSTCGVHEATLTEKGVASTPSGSIVVSLVLSFIYVRLTSVQ
jgi:hypothetical protein